LRGLTVTRGEVRMRADLRLGRSRLTVTIIPKLIVCVLQPLTLAACRCRLGLADAAVLPCRKRLPQARHTGETQYLQDGRRAF
jgi:hypothetical protein